MKYRSKLYIAFLAIIFSTTFISLGLVYWEVHHVLWKELQSKVLTVAETAAVGLNGDLIDEVQQSGDEKGPAFQEITARMRRIRDANQNNDIYVLWIYTLRANPDNPTQLEIGIEQDDNNPNIYSYARLPYPEGHNYGVDTHLNAPWVTPNLYTDRYGSFLSGFAPVYNSQGKYVTTVGVDVASAFVIKDLRGIKILALATLIATLLSGFVAATFLSAFVTHSLEEVASSVKQIGQGDLKARVQVSSKDEFGTLALAINHMAQGLEEHERLKLNFVRYVSKHVMEKILSADLSSVLKGERKKITILISDIRKFTTLAERLSPEEVVSLLNDYLEKMLDVIFSFNGTLDKFLGDGMMVEFGAPLDDPKQEENAVKTAIAMQHALKELCQGWSGKGRPELKMGIGIHTGPAVIGNIGSEKRMEYTAVGETITAATRLEQATKEFKVPILISEETAESVQGKFPLKRMGHVILPGREAPLIIYTIEGEVW